MIRDDKRRERETKYSEWYRTSFQEHAESPLTVAQIDRLAHKARAGDRRAYRRLWEVLASIAEVASGKVVRIGTYRGYERDDLRQEAMASMIRGLERWKPKEASFRSYSYARARFAMLDAINTGHMVNVPHHLAEAISSGVKDRKEIKRARPETLELARRAMQGTVPLTVGDDEEEDRDSAASEEEEGYDEVLDKLTAHQILDRSDVLTESQQRALKVWLEGGRDGVRELAAKLGITDQGAVNAVKRGIYRLRTYAGVA